MRIQRQIITIFIGAISLLLGLIILSGWIDPALNKLLTYIFSKKPGPNWPVYIRLSGAGIFLVGLLIITASHITFTLKIYRRLLKDYFKSVDEWFSIHLSKLMDLTGRDWSTFSFHFNFIDLFILIIFVILAIIFQISRSSHGFPTVVLGGDAANIASFAAGRAFPQLFSNDAILGDLRNIGLYVTIHLPITIWLQKFAGSFGLAYSLLLFPHVLLQYLSYYLLGRVIFNGRYWAFLFSLAISAPLELAGGEIWGVAGDAMPRFTFQVLIPLIMILLLTSWRDQPKRWPWIMVLSGLLAFVHPVSTPAWAFALWLGMWLCMPAEYTNRRKIIEMIKLGVILALSLLPYVFIYLKYHQGGETSMDYDLVYSILTNYFPNDLLNIPAAVKTLLNATGQYGLLGYSLIGFVFSVLYFRTERPMIKQLLIWMAGISIVTILVPYVEQTIERTFRIIPLQTELMRGMRYLVPFLFVFWFYPFAQITKRAKKTWITRSIYTLGTLTALIWLAVNPPLPILESRVVIRCWTQGRIICPDDTDYSDALKFIREKTPQNASFVVFLTNRWSGIEVRYLGLHPMAYAYKDRGQLAFTNLEALQTWYYFLRRENAIFSRNVSPTLELQQKRMIDFAFDAEANYMLTDFSFPAEVQKKLGVSAVYQNTKYTILRIYNMRK